MTILHWLAEGVGLTVIAILLLVAFMSARVE